MSQYFDLGEETLWNPSNGASRMFRRQVSVFEAELGLPSGIGPMENDECQIDPDTFETFLNALLNQHRRSGHTVWLALCEGFTVTALVLAERAGIEVDWARHAAIPDGPLRDVQVPAVRGTALPAAGAAWAADLRAKSGELARHMPR